MFEATLAGFVVDRPVYDEVTGRLDTSQIIVPQEPSGDPAGSDGYERRFKWYAVHVDQRYRSFLEEFGTTGVEELHTLICTCMISGSMPPLTQWFYRHHGPDAFRRIVKNDQYTTN